MSPQGAHNLVELRKRVNKEMKRAKSVRLSLVISYATLPRINKIIGSINWVDNVNWPT